MNEIVELAKAILVEEGAAMVPALYILAEIIKNAEIIESRFIPPVLMLISVILTPLLIGSYSAANIVQAILVTGGAVLYYETKKETIQGGDK